MGGFYWHFADRPALLAEMLDAWERRSVADVISRVEAETGGARARLARLFALATEGTSLLAVDLAVRDWARHDDAVAARLRRADNTRMGYMRELFGRDLRRSRRRRGALSAGVLAVDRQPLHRGRPRGAQSPGRPRPRSGAARRLAAETGRRGLALAAELHDVPGQRAHPDGLLGEAADLERRPHDAALAVGDDAPRARPRP